LVCCFRIYRETFSRFRAPRRHDARMTTQTFAADIVLDAALMHVPFDGWVETTLYRAAIARIRWFPSAGAVFHAAGRSQRWLCQRSDALLICCVSTMRGLTAAGSPPLYACGWVVEDKEAVARQHPVRADHRRRARSVQRMRSGTWVASSRDGTRHAQRSIHHGAVLAGQWQPQERGDVGVSGSPDRECHDIEKTSRDAATSWQTRGPMKLMERSAGPDPDDLPGRWTASAERPLMTLSTQAALSRSPGWWARGAQKLPPCGFQYPVTARS
jgi:hypothetical protein